MPNAKETKIMNARTVVKHALVQGGTPAYPFTGASSVDVGPVMGAAGSWPVPAYAVRTWIDGALREGRYADAGELSALIVASMHVSVRPVLVKAVGGVSLAKNGDAPVSSRPAECPTDEIELVGADGSWVTYERRSVIEGWRREAVRKGGYVMACAWGQVLRGE